MTDIRNIFEVLKAVLVESLSPHAWVGMWHLAALASVSGKNDNEHLPSTTSSENFHNKYGGNSVE